MASTSGVAIREANQTDLNALLALIDLAHLEQSAESCVQPLDPGNPQQWQFSDGDRAECIFVAIDLQPPQTGLDAVSESLPQPSSAIVGFARYGQYRVKRAYDRTVQSTVFVHPQARGRGVGSALYARLIDQARLKHVHVMLAAFGERNIAARQLLLRTGFVQLGAFPAMAPISKSNSAISRTCVEVEYYQLILQSAVGPTSDSAQAAPLSSPTAPFPICEASSITRPSLARPVSISVRNARIDDLPAMLAIVNHSIRESTANFDEHQYTLDDKRPWFEKHIQQYPILVACCSSPSCEAALSISTRDKSSDSGAADDRSPTSLSSLAAVATDTVLGYCYLSAYCSDQRAFDRCGESTIYVHPDAQGAGVGSALYRALFARAREMGIAAIVAVVGPDNIGSVRLHERAGFALVGTAVEVGLKFGQWQDRAFYCARLDADE